MCAPGRLTAGCLLPLIIKPPRKVALLTAGERLTKITAQLMRERVCSGDRVIDATIGNGHDTVLLAEWVGENGRVYGFDIQPQAIHNTTERLRLAGFLSRVDLHLICHSRIAEVMPADSSISLAIMNLGYLPGAAREPSTTTQTTLSAIRGSHALLRPGGTLIVTAYTGHLGGTDEAIAVRTCIAELPNIQIERLDPIEAPRPALFVARLQSQ